jgi:predicted CoA-binding protein
MRLRAYLRDQKKLPLWDSRQRGLKCYKTLEEIPYSVHVADLFLNPTRVSPVVDQAIKKRVGVIWMQLGVIHNEAAQKARKAGITVVMDKCMKQEHEKMGA